jgi:hypothetical protein
MMFLILTFVAGTVMAADIVLKDKEADVEMMNPSQDIVELRLNSGDGRIVMQITTAGEAVTEEMFEYEGSKRKMVTVEYAPVAGLAIDSDNNQATGDTPHAFHDHVNGFEWVVTVVVCADRKSKGNNTQDCEGAWNWDVLGAKANVELMTRTGELKIENLTPGQVKGRVITVVIPYSKIGVSAGDTVRLYPMEKVYPAEVETPFEPVLLKLQ